MELFRPLTLVISRVFAGIYIIGFAVWYALATGLKDLSGTPLGADFLNVYAAGVMVWRGQAADIYQWGPHSVVEREIAGYAAPYYGWHYPPLFLSVAALAALLPYLWAFALYMGVTFAGYWAVIRQLAPKSREYLWALAAFPGVFDNLINGQNGFITAALLGAGMLTLESNPTLAGCALGLMIYKPQFFVVIPFALVAGKHWRVLIMCSLTAVACLLISYAVLGASVWQAFFTSLPLTQHVILEEGVTGWQKIQSVFSQVRVWGFSVTTAYICQSVAAIGAVLATAYFWFHKTNLALRCGALCAAMLLSTPYLLDYDLVVLAVPLAMLLRHGADHTFMPYEKMLLTALWFLPIVARSAGAYGIILTPILLALLLIFCGHNRHILKT